jgi:ATP-dependent Zn protease
MIMFNYLENVVVRSLAQKQLEKTFENFAQRTDIDVKYNKKQLANLAMYMNDKDYNAKTITKLITEFLNKEMVDVFTQVNPKTQQPLLKTVKTIEYKIDMNSADKNAQEFFSERNREVLIICDKKDVHFYEAMTIPNVSIVCATDMNQAKQLLKKEIDCILLDVLLNTKKMKVVPTNLEDYDTEGVKLFDFISTYYNEIPLYVISKVQDNYAYKRYNSFLNGIAKDVIYIDQNKPSKAKALISDIQNGVELDADVSFLVENQKKLVYNAKQILSKDFSKLTILLSDLSLEHCQRDFSRKTYKMDTDKVRFDDIIGNDNAKNVLSYYSKVLVEQGFWKDNGFKRPKGLLIYGAPGTGKKMLAKAVAHQTNSVFIYQHANDLLLKAIGSSDGPAGVLREVIKQAAESSPAVLFIEDFTEFFFNVPDIDEKALVSELNNVNVDESHPILLIATTSEPKEFLPDAFIALFDRAIGLPRPNQKQREQFIEQYLSLRGITSLSKEAIHNFAIRTYYTTFAYIKNIIDFVIKNSHDKQITHEQLKEGIDLYDNGEEILGKSIEATRATAYHEVGHYLIDYLCGNHPPFVTIVPRGDYGGYTASDYHEDERLSTRKYYLDDICCCFGGRAAEYVIYGEKGINAGLSSDIEMATRMARWMVCEVGMGSFLYAMRGIPNKDVPAPMLEEIDKILHEQYDRAVKMLEENRDKLELITNELVKRKSMTGEEIERLLEN